MFKVDNEILKKSQEDQLEINEMLQHSIITKKSPEDNEKEEEVKKTSLKIMFMKQIKRTVISKTHT